MLFSPRFGSRSIAPEGAPTGAGTVGGGPMPYTCAPFRRFRSVNAEAPAPAGRRAALVFIFITVLIDILSFGVIIPVLPGLVRQFTGGDFAQAAWWVGTFGMLFAAIRERLAVADVPAPFRGNAIALITAGLMSLAFMGFSGLVKL